MFDGDVRVAMSATEMRTRPGRSRPDVVLTVAVDITDPFATEVDFAHGLQCANGLV